MRKKILVVVLVVIVIVGFFVFLGIRKIGNQVNPLKHSSISSLLSQARQFETKGSDSEAKVLYQRLINDFPEFSDVVDWQRKIEEINIKLLFSPAITPKSMIYQIRPGDTLEKIAREHKTTAELIMKSNNISDALIVSGRKIKI